MRRINLLAGLLWAILFPTLLFAADFTGRVVGVSDGDTISVMHDGKAEKIRLNGIDCPEKRQAFGERAKQFTSKLAFGNDVTVRVSGHDKYRRTIGDVILSDGRTLNKELVRAGLAWWYEKYSKDTTLRDLEAEARAARRGLWVYPDPVPPWEWRHRMMLSEQIKFS
ncbi:thermonuclease family protein [Nitrospira sp. Nam74]